MFSSDEDRQQVGAGVASAVIAGADVTAAGQVLLLLLLLVWASAE